MARLWLNVGLYLSLATLAASSSRQLKWIKKNYKPKTPVYLGGTWVADCRLNDPNVTVELITKHDQVDTTHTDIKKHIRQEGQNFTLFDLHERFSAEYCCHATGGAKIKDECLTEVHVKPYRENYEIEVKVDPNGTITLDYYYSLNVTCESIHRGTLKWSKIIDNKHWSQTRPRGKDKAEFFTEFAYLHIAKATNKTAGKYVCEKTDDFNNKKQVEIEIKVNDPKPPSITRFNQNTVVNTGGEATLHCGTKGSPKPKVTWYKKDKRLAWCTGGQQDRCYVEKNLMTYYVINKTTLVIKNVSYKNNHGLYSCVAQNIMGQINRTLFLTIHVKPKIKRSQGLQHCTTIPKETCELVCEVRPSVPKPNITWFYQPDRCTNATCKPSEKWQSLPSGVGQFNFTPTQLEKDGYRSILTVSSGTRSGFFQCYAKNILGADVSVYRVKRSELPSAVRLNKPSTRQWQWYIFAGISSSLVVIILIAFTKLYQNKKRYGQFYIIDDPIVKLDARKPLIEQSEKLRYDYQWEFPVKGIHLDHLLGSGHYGEVYLADASGVIVPDSKGRMRLKYIGNSTAFNRNDERKFTSKVAVKKLKHDATQAEYRELVSELKILIHIGWHENIVNLLGACTKVTKQRGIDILIITEYCPYGNVLDFLRSRRETFRLLQTKQVTDTGDELTLINLVKWAHQVAKGMEFLSSRKCLHRDLAARNVLIGNQITAKIADFGLARDIYKTMHYTVTTSMVPLKWTAIEALQDGISNYKSDVWSFGVFLWELFTLGGEPYPTLTTAHEVIDYLLSGNRMGKPSYCPFEIYTIMTDCWQQDPKARPTFTELVKTIGDFQDNIKDDENDQEVESEANLLLQ